MVGDEISEARDSFPSPLLLLFFNGLPVGPSCLLKKLFNASVDKFFFNCYTKKKKSFTACMQYIHECEPLMITKYLHFNKRVEQSKGNISIAARPCPFQFMDYKSVLWCVLPIFYSNTTKLRPFFSRASLKRKLKLQSPVPFC